MNQISLKDILFSYGLLGHEDIGVWIIRIFFSMALIAPMLFWWNKKLNCNKKFFLFIIIAFFLYEILYFISHYYLSKIQLTIFNVICMYTFSYGLLYLYGIRLTQFSKSLLEKQFAIIFFILLSYLLYYWEFNATIYPTQTFKYPPEGYYLSYALTISLILLYLSRYTKIFTVFMNNKLVAFIGSSTFWIYLWHWYYLKLYYLYHINTNYLIQFLLILLLTLATVYIQKNMLFLLLNKLPNDLKTMKQMLTTIFTG